ncbi:hypothetical protein SDC9_156025 [bioreactor metagenome]|uniref:Uncharacterized protein n=1 Tax=bioreactor metagenome TaxID=1076179 RepID=A0A645F4G5_9ZZZZ|nr:hypothetical protein [Christensenella sp.]
MSILLYHGSSVGSIHTLQPFTADHGNPYVYFTTSDVSAALYAARAVERPYYWSPIGYDAQGRITYTEAWRNAFLEVFSGKKGYLYCCEADEKKLLRFPSHPCLRLSVDPVPVSHREEIADLYAWFCQREQEGKIILQRFESLTQAQLILWHRAALEALATSFSMQSQENTFAHFVQEKMPAVWERFLLESNA